MGTANLLDALRGTRDLETVLVVTTDKVYENDEKGRAFVETDRLGGKDPYSGSKTCTEIVVASMRASFFRPWTADCDGTCWQRIGGGDWSTDRIVPDVVRAGTAGKSLELRYPDAIRPWQHVIEPLSGYLTYAEALATGRTRELALNFGPDPANSATCRRTCRCHGFIPGISGSMAQVRGPESAGVRPADAGFDARADCDRLAACARVSRNCRLDGRIGIVAQQSGADARSLCLEQIAAFEKRLLDQSEALSS